MSNSNSEEFLAFSEGVYPVEYPLHPSSSRVFLITNKQSKPSICIKMWEPPVNDWHQPEIPELQREYLIEGLGFNRKYAPGVYLGVAPIELIKDNKKDNETVKSVYLKTLLPYPQKKDLHEKQKYALIMRYLDEKWQLNYQLAHGLANEDGMKFLAYEICRMHKQLSSDIVELERSSKIGNNNTLLWKLSINKRLFNEALSLLSLSKEERERYEDINQIMEQAYKSFQELFLQRYANRHIKRCHGDLKVTNLWIQPTLDTTPGLPVPEPQLLALDCIDFQPEFCHIDTLSDVAMLAVDIESCLNSFAEEENVERSKALIQIFLDSYIDCSQESHTNIWPLLEYYMTEKAMVCTFMNTKYDKHPEIGKRFLPIAFSHAEKLSSL